MGSIVSDPLHAQSHDGAIFVCIFNVRDNNENEKQKKKMPKNPKMRIR